jgi:hypothetical protein
MAEAARRKRSHQALLKEKPFCVFCGGVKVATTIEHCPPRMMFRGKQRPNDLVFPCCNRCNSQTRQSDQVASLVARFYPSTDVDEADVQKLFKAVANNVPGLLQEMHLSDAEQEVGLEGLSVPSGAGALRADGPILSSYMLTFAAKLGLALRFELHQEPVPISGGVFPLWYSNVQAAKGKIPAELLATLPAPRTMRQGTKHVADQFQYSWTTTEEREHTLLYAVFRQSFAVAAFTANDRTWLLDRIAALAPNDRTELLDRAGGLRVLAPGEVKDPA